MVFIFESLFLNCLLVIVLAIIISNKVTFRYWLKRGVPMVTQPTIVFGHFRNVFFKKNCAGVMLKKVYAASRELGYRHCGSFAFSTPYYVPVDLEYVKNILQRDFNYFSERGSYLNEKDDPLSTNLFALGEAKWRVLRTKLSPAYTSGKMKTVFDGILNCSSKMHDAIEDNCRNKEAINIHDISECFTVDVIGSCAFGLDCNSFVKPEAEFVRKGRKIFHFSALRLVKTVFALRYPKIARQMGICFFDKELNSFFKNVVKDALEHRKTNNLSRKDFLQILIDLQEKHTRYQEKLHFSLEEITAQVFIFFAAGFETSSATLAFAVYELAINIQMQEKLREEINDVLALHNENITYDAVMEMKYLNQVIQETLRKYPPASILPRVAVKDYKIPDTDVVIEKGTHIMIPILGIHHDPEYYPDPSKFDPERFSEENKQKQLPFTYMPFGEGPRNCIGYRFGLMQVKVGLVKLLKHFKFQLNARTHVPLEMEPYSVTLKPKNGIVLNVEKVC